jgi:hypothetical protein
MATRKIGAKISALGSGIASGLSGAAGIVYKAIKRLEFKYGKLIPYELLVYAVERKELEVNKKELQDAIGFLKVQNAIYEPREGYIMAM